MSAYWAVLGAKFRELLQYRAAAAAGFATQLFWGLIRVMIFAAFYRFARSAQPMTYPEVVTYVWLGQAIVRLQPWGLDPEIASMVRSGNVAYELLRPVDLHTMWFVRSVALRAAPTILRAVPMLIIAWLLPGMMPPASAACIVAWLASMLSALLLSAALTEVLTISTLWTISGEGIARLVPSVTIVFSGLIVPIPLLPAWMQTIANALPFRGLMDTPARLYMGHIPPAEAFGVIGNQLLWTAAFILAGRWLLARGLRRLVVQGG